MTTVNLDSSARLMYEAIQQLGWDADPSSLTKRVKRLDLGLPAEDEFICILSWLGKCSLVHKLEQEQFPFSSRNRFQVPDLLALFETKLGPSVVLIEVKVSNRTKLVWRLDYLKKLKDYSSSLDLPLLIAWKLKDTWTLADTNCFSKAKTNIHLSFETAMENNLLNLLAGDFSYLMKPNVGLHFVLKKERLVSETGSDENGLGQEWIGRIVEAFFTNSEGQKVPSLPSGLWPLFISAGPKPQNRVEGNLVYHSFVIPENQGWNLAHCALPVLMKFTMKNANNIHWRKQLVEHKFPVKIKQFYMAAQKGIKEGYVQYVFHIKPPNIPDFLKGVENTEHGGPGRRP